MKFMGKNNKIDALSGHSSFSLKGWTYLNKPAAFNCRFASVGMTF